MYGRNKKPLIIVLFLLLVVFGVVGYAYLQRTLVINGDTTVQKNTWDVRFTTITPIRNDGEIITAPTVSNNTNIAFAVKLNKPGDTYIFAAIIENRGSLDAMISGTPVISGLEDMASYLEAHVTYGDGATITDKDLLKKDSKETIRVVINYKRNITEADIASLSESDVTKVMRLSVSYVQAESANQRIVTHKLCIKADNLHTETCNRTSDGCIDNGYSQGDTITYGHTDAAKLLNNSLSNGVSGGYALTCDVNGDNVYDEDTERFYYVSDLYTGTTEGVDQFDNDYAVLIYYKNYGSSGVRYYYENSLTENWHGPLTLLNTTGALPERSNWKNPGIGLKSTQRNIYTETGTYATSGGTIENPFTYTNKVARLLTTHEIDKALNSTSRTTAGYLDNAEYLMEDSIYTKTSGCSGGSCSYWLETPRASDSSRTWYVHGRNRYVGYVDVLSTSGSRPAIEVLKTNISLN